jgi:hypothetical protein
VRGFAVAAGGWDEPGVDRPSLRLVVYDVDDASAAVIELDARRARDEPPREDGGIILAW